jgi:hypothetical protein
MCGVFLKFADACVCVCGFCFFLQSNAEEDGLMSCNKCLATSGKSDDIIVEDGAAAGVADEGKKKAEKWRILGRDLSAAKNIRMAGISLIDKKERPIHLQRPTSAAAVTPEADKRKKRQTTTSSSVLRGLPLRN